MPLKFFVVALEQLEAGEESLNAFLRSHRILAIDRRWVEAGANQPSHIRHV